MIKRKSELPNYWLHGVRKTSEGWCAIAAKICGSSLDGPPLISQPQPGKIGRNAVIGHAQEQMQLQQDIEETGREYKPTFTLHPKIKQRLEESEEK